MNERHKKCYYCVVLLSLFLLTACHPSNRKFDANKAMDDAKYQVNLGPRIPDSLAHHTTAAWIYGVLKENGWETEYQTTVVQNHRIINVVGKKGSGHPWIILGSHYDSRLYADQDPEINKRQTPVPGANDGASTVAILLELARVYANNFPQDVWPKQIWLVFFDAEDNGDIPGWEWCLGSQSFVDSLVDQPDEAVVIDMVGDANLNIYMESNSTNRLSHEIWEQAERLGYSNYFIPKTKYAIIDDHIPFLRAGIPAVDIIDFDYPYWHTTRDTIDKLSPNSMLVVGNTLSAWLRTIPTP